VIEPLLRYMFTVIGLTEYIRSQLGRVETTANDNTYCLIAWDKYDKLIGKICISTEDDYLKSKLVLFLSLLAEEIKSREKEKNR